MSTTKDIILGTIEVLEIKDSFPYSLGNFISSEMINVIGRGYYNTDTPQNGDYRYRLDIEIQNEKDDYINKQLVALLMNPSNTYPDTGFDYTIKNIIRIAYKMKYKNIVVFNSSPYIDGNSDRQRNQQQNTSINQNYIDNNTMYVNNYLTSTKVFDFLIAWGGDKSKITNEQTYLQTYYNLKTEKDEIPIIYTYGKTKNNKPCHASIRVQNKYGYVSKFLNDGKFIELEIIKRRYRNADLYTFKAQN